MSNRHKNAPKRPRGTGYPDPTKDRTAHLKAQGVPQMTKHSLGLLSRAELSDDEFTAALAAMHRESDRAAAIMGAAFVEDGLDVVIGAMLANREDQAALFHDPGAPFGTLRAKTVAAYGLGLCSKRVAADIDEIRSIRNQFSHALRPISFNTPEVWAACERLTLYAPENLIGLQQPDPTRARFRFEIACQGIWQRLMKRASSIYSEWEKKLKTAALAKDLLDGSIAGSLQGSADDILGLNSPVQLREQDQG